MDTIDHKKWLIQRIDATFEVHINWMNDDKEKFQNFKQKEIERWDNLGKSILGSIAFIVSILGLIFSGSILTALPFIVWIIFFGMLLYIGALLFKDRNEAIFTRIENKSDESNNIIYHVMGYFHKNSMEIEMYTPNDYDLFYIFFVFYIIPIRHLGEYQSLEKSIRSLFISEPARKFLREKRLAAKHSLDNAVQKYEKEKPTYVTNNFLNPLLKIGDYLLDYRNGIEVKNFTS